MFSEILFLFSGWWSIIAVTAEGLVGSATSNRVAGQQQSESKEI